MQLLQQVKKYIDENELLRDNEKVIIGVSGGADSMALLHTLHSLGYAFVVAHCNFHLRGEESDRDEQFVKDYCSQHGFELVSVSFDTYAYMQQHGISLEMAARRLRYSWFEECRQKYNADKIAVAHHLDDSVETFLINLVRGTGIKGLTGIPPSNGKIIRPLLGVSQDEILSYVRENQLPYVTDSTNLESIYLRNNIRLNIIPMFEKINPSFKQTISRTSNYLSDVEKIYNGHIQKLTQEVFNDNKIHIARLMDSGYAKTLLFEILHPLGFNSATIDTVYDSLNGIAGKRFYSDIYCLVKDRDYLIVDKREEKENGCFLIDENVPAVDFPVRLTIETIEKKEGAFNPDKSKSILYLDRDSVHFPLTVRRWEQGDRFVPFGMKGSKKVSDYFTDNKFSLIDKQKTWLLCDAKGNILWIIGERADNRFRVTGKTNRILKIELTEQ